MEPAVERFDEGVLPWCPVDEGQPMQHGDDVVGIDGSVDSAATPVENSSTPPRAVPKGAFGAIQAVLRVVAVASVLERQRPDYDTGVSSAPPQRARMSFSG